MEQMPISLHFVCLGSVSFGYILPLFVGGKLWERVSLLRHDLIWGPYLEKQVLELNLFGSKAEGKKAL